MKQSRVSLTVVMFYTIVLMHIIILIVYLLVSPKQHHQNLLHSHSMFSNLSKVLQPNSKVLQQNDNYSLFVKRQRAVQNHIIERTLWECHGICNQCIPEYKELPKSSSRFNWNDDNDCPVQCESIDIEKELTMENVGCWKGSASKICGNTRRTSDVHMQYFSWHDVDFMRDPISYENKTLFISSFISNCNGGDRLEWMSVLKNELLTLGENRVHNYGSCNRDSTNPYEAFSSAKAKDLIAQQNLFIFSFENSQTEDYITEKMFDMLSSGTVPVYRGATNYRMYSPSQKSVVFASEFKNPKDLARYLVNISKKDYDQYLEWKHKGPDLKWITMIDESIVHSDCRICIWISDSQHLLKDKGHRWWIRERGMSKFTGFNENNQSWEQLLFQISNAFVDPSKPFGSGAVVHIYEAWDRNACTLQSIEQLKKLPIGAHLEVILENPGWKKRPFFEAWWKTHGMPLGYDVYTV